jgi:hypothetical protein
MHTSMVGNVHIMHFAFNPFFHLVDFFNSLGLKFVAPSDALLGSLVDSIKSLR